MSQHTKTQSLVYGNLPPQAPELEEAVLGAILLEHDKLEAVLQITRTPDVLYTPANQKIYAAIQHLHTAGRIVDLLTVPEELKRHGELEIIGGVYYLVQLTAGVVSSAHTEAHAKIVLEKWMGREIIRLSAAAMKAAYEDSVDIFDQLDKLEMSLSAITGQLRSSQIKTLGQVLKPAVEEMKEAQKHPAATLGLSTGISDLDRVTKGLQKSNLIVLAAGTGEGKTTLALNIASNLSNAGIPVGFFSLEMRDRELVHKILSGEIQEDAASVMSGNFSLDKWSNLEQHVMTRLYKAPLHLYDVGGLNIIEARAIARAMVNKHGCQLLAFDYIQLIRGVPGKRYGTREEEVNEVSKNLKALAMELDVPILALSQLNRPPKGSRAQMPELPDLRESGAIEQDANSVWFIWRPASHGLSEVDGNLCTEMHAFINIAKARMGNTGKIKVKYDRPFNKFSDDMDILPNAFEPRPPSAYTPGLNAAGIRQSGLDFTVPRSEQEQDDDKPFG